MGFKNDVLFALRTLFKSKLVAVVTISSLALIVAGNTVIFSIINSLLIRPLPFDPDGQLALVWRADEKRSFSRLGMSAPDFNEYRERQRVFTEVAGYNSGGVNLTGTDKPEALAFAEVTASFFKTLHAPVAHGRALQEADVAPGAAPVVVLSYRLFERRFGADQSLIGETIELDRRPYEVVGVLEKDFTFINQEDLWLPLIIDPAAIDREENVVWPLLGKMREGVTLDEVRADLGAIAADLAKNYPDVNRNIGIHTSSFRGLIPGPEDAKLFGFVQGAGIFLLLIACANLANLLLARGQVRQRELALRAAIGASKSRIIRQLLTESIVLAMIGGLLGIFLGYVGVGVVGNALGDDIPALYKPILDVRVLLFSVALSAFAGLAFGTFPALRAAGNNLIDLMKEGGRGAAGSKRVLGKALVVTQVTLALIVLSSTGQLLNAFMGARDADPGFNDEDLLTFSVALPEDQYTEASQRIAFFEEMQRELSALPGTNGVAGVSNFPRSFNTGAARIKNPADSDAEESRHFAGSFVVMPGYFDTLEIPLLRGRDFSLTDNLDAGRVAIVDRRFAERFWPDEDPLGRQILVNDEEHTIVGMVKNVTNQRIAEFAGEANATIYLPAAQQDERRTFSFMLRSAGGDPMALAAGVRSTVRGLDPNLPLARLQSYDDLLAQVYVGITVFGRLIACFGAVALFLSALGVYGVLAFSVTQRTREIGVRVALGASRSKVLGMVLREGLVLAGIGVAVALPAIAGVMKMLESVIPGLAAGGVTLVPTLVALMLGTILFASMVPARRAAGLSPTEALRVD